MITTVQCSVCSQLNNKHRVVVTDFRLHHTCSIIILDIRISTDASRRMYYFLLTIIIIMNEIRVYIIRYNQLMYDKVQSTNV